jgi:hypothetical protein
MAFFSVSDIIIAGTLFLNALALISSKMKPNEIGQKQNREDANNLDDDVSEITHLTGEMNYDPSSSVFSI